MCFMESPYSTRRKQRVYKNYKKHLHSRAKIYLEKLEYVFHIKKDVKLLILQYQSFY